MVRTGSTGSTSLYHRLRNAQISCDINDEPGFIPLDILEIEITEHSVRDALSKGSRRAAALKLLRVNSSVQLPRRVVDEAKKVFAILVYIDEPDAIRELLADGLTDRQLPLLLGEDGSTPISQSGRIFRSFAIMRDQRVNEFIEKQWIVMAPSLDTSGQHIELDRRCPLPFVTTDQTGRTNTSAVYKTKLHPAHYHGPEFPQSLEYVATKEFMETDLFQREKENLKTLSSLSHDHLIKHMATLSRNKKHYAIFPWADGGTLANFWFKEEKRIKDTYLITWCLRQMRGISEAVEALHSLNCRHGDMKPENILHFKGLDGGTLVVADVGVSKTHKQETLARQGLGTETRATTPSYEAPEAFAHHSSPRARRFDIWSVGCIFLEFALWILHDMETINSFSAARHAPDFEFYLLNRETSESPRIPAIHPTVTKAFSLLRQDPRCSNGTIFEDFINFVEERMLQVEVDQRAGADELVEKLKSIIAAVEKDPAHLLNNVDAPPNKLRFPKRTQTGAFEPANGSILE